MLWVRLAVCILQLTTYANKEFEARASIYHETNLETTCDNTLLI